MIETQKHQQSFEALGLFQIDFGLMTLISEIFLSTEHKFGEKMLKYHELLFYYIRIQKRIPLLFLHTVQFSIQRYQIRGI